MPKKAEQLDDATAQMVATAYKDGSSVRDLSSMLGYSELLIRRALRDQKVPVRKFPQVLRDRNQKILARHKEGAGLTEIAREFGLTKQRIYVIVSRGY